MGKYKVACTGSIILLLIIAGYALAKDSTKTDTRKKSTVTISQFRITDQVSGWKEEKDSYIVFDPAGLYDIIDGGADFYIAFGLKKGMYQRLKGTETRQCDIFAEDYGSIKNAKKIFNAKKEQISEPVKIDGLADSVVVAEMVIGGLNVFVHNGACYFEVLLSGFDKNETALENAGTLVRYLLRVRP